MSDEKPIREPGAGWSLGADGFSRAFWLAMALVLAAIGVFLLASGYVGYGAMLLVIALAAAVNIF